MELPESPNKSNVQSFMFIFHCLDKNTNDLKDRDWAEQLPKKRSVRHDTSKQTSEATWISKDELKKNDPEVYEQYSACYLSGSEFSNPGSIDAGQI